MKNSIIIASLLVLITSSSYAQKYMTRTGKISFYSSTPIEKIEAFNNETAGIMDGKTGDLIFQVPIKSFKFEKELMQEHFNEDYMESNKYPKAEFKGKITNISTVNFSTEGVYNVTAAGTLNMHGVTQNLEVPGTVTVKGKDLTLNAKFIVMTKDYGIKIPSVVEGKIAKEIEVTVNSVLNPR